MAVIGYESEIASRVVIKRNDTFTCGKCATFVTRPHVGDIDATFTRKHGKKSVLFEFLKLIDFALALMIISS